MHRVLGFLARPVCSSWNVRLPALSPPLSAPPPKIAPASRPVSPAPGPGSLWDWGAGFAGDAACRGVGYGV